MNLIYFKKIKNKKEVFKYKISKNYNLKDVDNINGVKETVYNRDHLNKFSKEQIY